MEIERELAELDSIRVEQYKLIREHEKCLAKTERLELITNALTDSLYYYRSNIEQLKYEMKMVNLRKDNVYLKYSQLKEIQNRKELKNYRKSDERKIHLLGFVSVVLFALLILK